LIDGLPISRRADIYAGLLLVDSKVFRNERWREQDILIDRRQLLLAVRARKLFERPERRDEAVVCIV